MNFGINLKKIRQDNNLTQEELAKKIYTSRSNIANYENNKNMPSVDMLEKLSKLFNCSMDYLMGITSYKNPKEDLEKELYKLDLSEDEFDSLIKKFNEKSQLEITMEYLKDLANSSQKRETLIIGTILKYINDYIPDFYTNLTETEERELNKTIESNLLKAKSLFNSLDKNKIIHNYNKVTAEEWNNENRYKKNIHTDGSVSYSEKFYMCPVYGKISAGIPNWAEECLDGYLPIDPNLMNIINPEECFFLRVNGESMNKVIRNGAYALIRKQDIVKDGEIAVVLVNGFEATLKKFSRQGDFVILEPMSNDPTFTTQIYDKKTEIKIIGKYIGKFEIN